MARCAARAPESDVFRRADWSRVADAVTIVRYLEAHTDELAIAAGGLAPSQLAHVADGHRASLDDRPRTGVRAAAVTKAVTLGVEIDDVLDPARPRLVGRQVLDVRARAVRAHHPDELVGPGPTCTSVEVGLTPRSV